MVETAKQISVFLENKPGRLANVLSAMEKEKVNITGLTVMDSHEHSVLRMVPSDVDGARKVLKSLNAPFTESDVLLVELRNQPGALAHVCEILAADHINIDHCYASAGGRNGRTYGIFKVSNTAKAIKLLDKPTPPKARFQRKPMPRR
ncbi:MAG: acetolactate synthase [Gemmatales bacterium]|nr:MAG: acetolactate synthase [Gemmatales bacterium]